MVGRTIRHYKILEKIGAGGMGEVYAAEDLKLHRKVALKILPDSVASDPDRRVRFEREATAVASLNHPNIVTLHSIEEDEGIHFITMELVEGKTLSEFIPRAGLPLRRFFELAIPLSDAVAAAHRAGVVHRDLKPDNIIVANDGRLKILDFGLAKLREAPEEAAEASALPTRHLTGQGQILGTVAYMSPEQVEGKVVDHRTDIFSLGIVLYEMATGRRPFLGDTQASIISSILRDAPSSASDLNPSLPRHLGRILRQCLAKNPEERTQSAQDVRNQLVDLRVETESGALVEGVGPAAAAPLAVGRRPLILAVVVALLAVLLAALFVLRRAGPTAGSERGGAVEGTQLKVTDLPGAEVTPSISPDGKVIAYASRSAGNWDIYVQRIGGSNPVNLTRDSAEDDVQPAFSPDGERIAFRSSRNGGGIYLMGATGESVVRISDFGFRPAWSPDGGQIVVQTSDFVQPAGRPGLSELWTIDVKTGKSRKLFGPDAVQPSWSPGGKRIAYWAIPTGGGQRDIWTIPAEGGTPVPVTQDPPLDWDPIWSPDGQYLYFSSERSGNMNLWRVRIDESSGKTLGSPEAVTRGAAATIHSPSVSKDGRRLAYVASVEFYGLRRVAVNVAQNKAAPDPAPLIRGSSVIVWPSISPDGQSIAYTTRSAGEKPGMVREEIVILSRDGTSRRQVVASESRNRIARWSPSGDRLVFASDRTGDYQIYTVRPDGGDLQAFDPNLHNTIYPIWSPKGDRLIITHLDQKLSQFIVPWPRGSAPPEDIPPMPDSKVGFLPADWSPDGSRLAGSRQQSGGVASGIVVYDFQSRHYDLFTERGNAPHWIDDGHVLYTDVDLQKLYVLDTKTREVRELPLNLKSTFDTFSVSLSRDGKTLLVAEIDSEADLWLMDLQ
jgi:Tol biopolymer transport system component/predicted Ser/Thr protein kinase